MDKQIQTLKYCYIVERDGRTMDHVFFTQFYSALQVKRLLISKGYPKDICVYMRGY